MSEPLAAFVKLQIDRPRLVNWLAAKPQSTAHWNDWRDVGGQWYFSDGPSPLADLPEDELQGTLDVVDGWLERYEDNLALLQWVLDSAPPEARIAALSATQDVFVAGSLMFSENLSDHLLFLTLVRSASDYLPRDGHGLALVHNFVFGYPEDEKPTAALRLMPGGQSSFLAGAERMSVVPAFQPFADAMLESVPMPDFPDPHQFDDLVVKVRG